MAGERLAVVEVLVVVSLLVLQMFALRRRTPASVVPTVGADEETSHYPKLIQTIVVAMVDINEQEAGFIVPSRKERWNHNLGFPHCRAITKLAYLERPSG